jgi:chorismate--pyruvate lyase
MSLWLSNFDGMSEGPSASVAAWLEMPTSITEKAKASCHSVRLQVLSEQWVKNPPCTPLFKRGETPHGDCQKGADKVFVREIVMFCNEKPAWYAQTLIPEKTYERRAEQFKNLQERSISTILFTDPHIVRENFVYAYLTKSTSEYQEAIQYYRPNAQGPMPQGLWARKSVFRIDGEPLSIMEVFFPDIFGEGA